MKRAVFAWDTETCLIRPGHALPELVCLQYTTGGDPTILHQADPACYETIKSALMGEELLVGHNVAYDFGVIYKKWPDLMPHILAAYDEGRVFCTMVADKLRRIRGGEKNQDGGSMASLMTEFYGYTPPKGLDTWRLRYSELMHVPVQEWPRSALEYAEDDPVWTLAIYNKLADLNLADVERQTAHSFWMTLMGDHGVITDPDAVDRAIAHLEIKHQEDIRWLVKEGLLSPQKDGSYKRNTKPAKERMIAVMGKLGVPYKQTQSGGVSLDEDACKSSGDKLLQAYASYTSQSTQLQRLNDLYKSPIQASFTSLVDTGRTSCRKGTLTNGFQLQNPPRSGPIRECFVPRPGYVFLGTDLDTAELRSWAQICLWVTGQSELAKALNQGIDPHLLLAADILNVPYEVAKARYDAGESEVDETRQLAKIPNFGYPGGMGAPTLVDFARATYRTIIAPYKAAELKQTWLRRWPEAEGYFRYVNSHFNGRDTATIVQFKSGRVRGDVYFTEACNSFFQGLTADAAKACGWRITKECYVDHGTALFGSRLWNFPHDEFLLETPAHLGHDAAQRLKALVEDEVSRWMPDVVAKTTPVLMDRWYKKAKPKFDQNGRLRPFTASDLPAISTKAA